MAAKHSLTTPVVDILVVDDSIASLKLLAEILSQAGYRVRPAERSQVALESALAHPPSLILLDVKMPEMSGFELCARLQQDERTRDIPIIFVSALQDVQDRIQGFEVGGVDFISKPFQESEVLARVKTHLQLRYTQLHLEELVAERTAELTQTNKTLQTEIAERKRAVLEREASWHLLGLVIDNVPALVSYVDKRQHYRFVNRRYEQVYGISQSEFVDKHVQEMLGPEGYAAAEPHIAAVLAGDDVSYEQAFHYPDIGQRWMRIEYVPDRDHAGIVQGFIGMVSDITERKQMEEALRESEEKFRTLATNTEEIVYMIAKDGTFLLSEGKGLSKLGLQPGAVVGESVFELYKDFPDMLDAMRKTFGGETITIEVEVGDYYFRNWYTPHKDQQGEIIGLLGLSINITERRRAEEMLKADLAYHREGLAVLVQRHSLAVKISSFGIWDWDVAKNLMTWDNKMFEIYGIEKKIPLPYEEWLHLIHPDDLPGVEALMRTVVETRSEAFLEYRIVRPDGELRHITLAGTVVLNDAGEVVKVIGINQDITERKRLETQEQEAVAAHERNRLAQDLHDSVTQGLYSASLIAETLPLIWEENPEEGLRGLQQLQRFAYGALAEMRTLLLELRPSTLADQELPVLLRQLEDTMMARTQTVVTTTVVGDCTAPTDVKIALYRIAQEALNNVVKHAQAGHAVISLHDDGSQITLRVSDDGCGFDAQDAQPQALGINIMRERAKVIGATLNITTRQNQGTEVLVEWRPS